MTLPPQTWEVFLAALFTALATGVGALPFALVRQFSRRWLGIFNSLAAGLMLGASHGLINEGLNRNLGLLLLGMAAGVGFIMALNRKLEADKSQAIQAFQGAGGMKALLIVGVMTLHSFAEGIGLGVSYGGGQALGVFITLAIAIHNIPEGLAISLILVPRGAAWWKASLWSIFSSLPQPLMAVPAFLLVSLFEPVLPFGLGLAAGAMIWMAFAELVPEALAELNASSVGATVTAGLAAMIALQTLL
jgi:zinc transporter ZupT